MASGSSPPSFSPSLSPPLSTSVSPSSSPSPSSLPPPSALPAQPPVINYVLGFLLVGLAWGFTTPFLRRAARDHHPPPHPLLQREAIRTSAVRRRLYGAFFSVLDLLRNPRYAAPLLINLTGSVWFFLLIGQAELSLTVPIVNTLAFLFTVIGEWWVENKVISRDTGVGMALSLAGIALCVYSKSS